MLVLFPCFDFASVTVVLLNLSSVFSCIICLLQCGHTKDAWVARLGKQHFHTKWFCFGFFFLSPTHRNNWLAWSVVRDVNMHVRSLCYLLLSIHMMFNSMKAVKHHLCAARGCACWQQQCINAEFEIDFSYDIPDK